jgi:hypothetical protein
LFASRRVRASATVTVSLVIEPPKPASHSVATHRCPAADIEDHPELRARWRALPKPIKPEDWVTETGAEHVPGSLLVAEAERRPEGYYPVYG